MTLFYPDAPGGDLLWAVRLLVGTATAVSIVLAFTAIRRREIPTHRAWMIRAYALAAGAGTQLLTVGIGKAAFGAGDLSRALAMTAAWLINLAIAEWIIRRPARRRRRRARSATRAVMVGSP
jgi:membrane-associated PAP2 superfamily phosphatase